MGNSVLISATKFALCRKLTSSILQAQTQRGRAVIRGSNPAVKTLQDIHTRRPSTPQAMTALHPQRILEQVHLQHRVQSTPEVEAHPAFPMVGRLPTHDLARNYIKAVLLKTLLFVVSQMMAKDTAPVTVRFQQRESKRMVSHTPTVYQPHPGIISRQQVNLQRLVM